MTDAPAPPTDAPPPPRPMTGGAVMAAAGRVTVAATGAATTIAIARLLGPEGSGTYFLAQSLVLLLTVAATLGIEHGIAYYVSSGAWPARDAYRAALKMAAVGGTVVAALAMGVRLLAPSAFGDLSVWLTLAVVAGVPFALAWFYGTFVALAVDRYEAYVLPPAVQSTLALALAIPAAALLGVGAAVVGLTVAAVVVGAGTVAWGRRRLPVTAAVSPPGAVRRAITFGVKGYAANALQMINYRLDLFVLSAAASTAAVGHYSVAVAVTTVIWLLPGAISDVLFPRVAHLSARDGEDAEAHREMVEVKSLRHVSLACVAATLVLAAALLALVVPIYGAAFRPAIDLGLILLPGAALLGIGSVLGATIVGRGRPQYTLYVALVTTPVTVALYVALIPRLGATGAALASSISYTLNFALSALAYRRVTGRPVLSTLIPTRGELEDLWRARTAIATRVRALRR